MPHESTYVATPKHWLDLIATILLNHVGKELREIQELRNSFVPSVTAAHVGYEQTRRQLRRRSVELCKLTLSRLLLMCAGRDRSKGSEPLRAFGGIVLFLKPLLPVLAVRIYVLLCDERQRIY